MTHSLIFSLQCSKQSLSCSVNNTDSYYRILMYLHLFSVVFLDPLHPKYIIHQKMLKKKSLPVIRRRANPPHCQSLTVESNNVHIFLAYSPENRSSCLIARDKQKARRMSNKTKQVPPPRSTKNRQVPFPATTNFKDVFCLTAPRHIQCFTTLKGTRTLLYLSLQKRSRQYCSRLLAKVAKWKTANGKTGISNRCQKASDRQGERNPRILLKATVIQASRLESGNDKTFKYSGHKLPDPNFGQDNMQTKFRFGEHK